MLVAFILILEIQFFFCVLRKIAASVQTPVLKLLVIGIRQAGEHIECFQQHGFHIRQAEREQAARKDSNCFRSWLISLEVPWRDPELQWMRAGSRKPVR